MGMIKSIFIFVLSFLLFLSTFIMTLTLIFNTSLKYENIKPYLYNYSIEKGTYSELRIDFLNTYPDIKMYCTNSNETYPYYFQNYLFEINCKTSNKNFSTQFDSIFNNYLYKKYHKTYSCSFFDCLSTEDIGFYIFGENSKKYWAKNFRFFLLTSLILFALLILISNIRASAFITSGVILIINSFLFKKVTWLISILPKIIPSNFLNAMFFTSSNIYFILFILGIILILFGIGYYLFRFGFKIEKIFSKYFGKEKEKRKIEKQILKEIKSKKHKKTLKENQFL